MCDSSTQDLTANRSKNHMAFKYWLQNKATEQEKALQHPSWPPPPKSISYALSTNNCVPYSWALFWWGFWGYTYISTNDTSWTLIQHTLAGTLERRRHDEDRQAATPRRMDGLQEQELPDHDTGLQPCKPCDPDTKLSKHNAWSPELKHHKHMQLMILSLPQVETALGVTSVQEKDINYEWMSSEVQLANDRPKQ